MARDRQRAKKRQAERRARRLEQEGNGEQPRDDARADGNAQPEPARQPEPAPGIDPYLQAGAPPPDEGHSETVVRDEPEVDELDEDVDPELVADAEEAGALEGAPPADETEGYAPRGKRGRETPEAGAPTSGGNRVVQFLTAVWAELQRVQWPNRQALTTLTGVVLGFVLLAGGYLGLLDVIFSELVKAIL